MCIKGNITTGCTYGRQNKYKSKLYWDLSKGRNEKISYVVLLHKMCHVHNIQWFYCQSCYKMHYKFFDK